MEFPGRAVGRWSPRSPDLKKMNLFLRCIIKSKVGVYMISPSTTYISSKILTGVLLKTCINKAVDRARYFSSSWTS
jgi:hypothetical protein